LAAVIDCLLESFTEFSFLVASALCDEESFLVFTSSFFDTALTVDSTRLGGMIGDSFLLEDVALSSLGRSLLLCLSDDDGGGGGGDFLFKLASSL
jgi:hypothetical protein